MDYLKANWIHFILSRTIYLELMLKLFFFLYLILETAFFNTIFVTEFW